MEGPAKRVFDSIKEKMDKTISVLKEEYRGMRTGRATPALVENVKVNYYGASTSLKHIANISAPQPALLVIQPYDPSVMDQIVKAIQKSDTGFNPSVDKNIIRIAVPSLSEERRGQLVIKAKESDESAKVSLRNIRRDVNKELEAMKGKSELTEDEFFRYKQKVQDVLKEHEEEINRLFAAKKEELLTI